MSQLKVAQPALEIDSVLFSQYKQSLSKGAKIITYGTAGFRSHADNLHHICLRVGIFQSLISKLEKDKVLGLVITASHNPIQDNGLKQSDFSGAMIRPEFEQMVDVFVQEPNLQKAVDDVIKYMTSNFPNYSVQNPGMIFLGRDTRPSSSVLQNLISMGIQSVGGHLRDFGQVTTPIIHFLVKYNNENDHEFTLETPTQQIKDVYHKWFRTHYTNFMKNLGYQKNDDIIVLDHANGIGGLHMADFLEDIREHFNVVAINTGKNEGELQYLNEDCGAEYVHKKQKYPRGAWDLFQGLDKAKVRGVSFDGDADRIVYYLPTNNPNQLVLLDGDREISLFATLFQTLLRQIHDLQVKLQKTGDVFVNEDFSSWEIGMVQTAYANGASTKYLKSRNLTCQIVANGVKNSHPMAEKFTIGIYCESNGHGTFHVDHKKLELLEIILKNKANSENPEVAQFYKLIDLLYSYSNTQNMIMGDSMTNFMVIEMAMAYLKISHKDWLAFYTDLYCLNSTVKVADRTKIKVVKTEDRITEPISLQNGIDQVVGKNPGTRAFIRPSGTEDIVRVYVEAENMEIVKSMTKELTTLLMNNPDIN